MNKKYFIDLNYSLANEDTIVELDLMAENSKNVFVIPSSGAQALPLLSKNPLEMDIVDISYGQLALTELRREAQKVFSNEEWIYFMGYAGDLVDFSFKKEDRLMMFRKLSLTDETRNYWLSSENLWKDQGFIWLGRWEGFFKKLSDSTRKILGYDFERFFEANTLEEQREIYLKHWPAKRFKFFLSIVTSKNFMDTLLYRGFFAGADSKKTKPISAAEHIDSSYRNIFMNHLAKENFFMQMLFLGKIKYKKALPIEAREDIYNKSQKATTVIRYHKGPYEQFLYSKAYDFVHMSDVLSYVSDEDGSALLSRLHPDTNTGSIVVARAFLKSPSTWEADGWKRQHDWEKQALVKDGTGVYDFLISKKGN